MLPQELKPTQLITNKQRLDCIICNYRVAPNDESAFSTFSCSVRAFMGEKFKIWRCPECQTIHCLDVVDLDHYYAKYPLLQTELTWIFKFIYSNLHRRLKKHGFSKASSLLDYGCGVNGLFVQYLQQQGFTNSYGYDPYGSFDGFGNPKILKHGPFDYISLQDVIEHIEYPYLLLNQLDSLLSPGGYILIGTPNAANLNVNQTDVPDDIHLIHVPYHLHIYTRETLESLGRNQGWEPIDFFDRGFDDTPWFGFNVRTWNVYASIMDGSVDSVYEPFQLRKALSSPKFLFYATFGYWLSFHSRMGIIFRKSN